VSSPLIWIIFPILAAGLLWIIQGRQKLTIAIGTGVALFLALLAWKLPIDTAISLGPLSLKIASGLGIFGRRLTLTQGESSVLFLIYFIGALWFAAAGVGGMHRNFVPLGLAMAGFLVAALAVEPFLYAALFIEIAVLISIPLLTPPERRVSPGALRYLIMQTLGMPFILFTGWMLAGADTGPLNPALAVRAGVLLGLGFAFLLAIFPFYTWIPLLSEQVAPYAAGYIFIMLPTAVLFFGMDFLDQYAWLRETTQLYTFLEYTGVVMVATGGIWAAFQKHLGRILGYTVIVETGLSLLAMSLGTGEGMQVFALLFLPRILGLALMALSLAVITSRMGSLDLDRLDGLLYRLPLAGASLILAIFSLAGLPLLASFPVRQLLLEDVSQRSPLVAFWVLAGSLGLLLAGFRVLATFVRGDALERLKLGEGWLQAVLLSLGSLGLVAIGLFPQLFEPAMLSLLTAYANLAH
jgi:NADH-quinone oxidoreductase subunit N